MRDPPCNDKAQRTDVLVFPVFIDLCIVFFLLLFNGFFAMAELALVSARRARLRQMADDGVRGAKKALIVAEDSASFLSIVQIGVTVNSILAGAFSGSAMAGPIGDVLDTIPWIAPHGHSVAMVLTVVGVSYLSLVLGELAPKRIGLAHAESIAVRVAPVMHTLSVAAAPIVWVLGVSTNFVLKLMRMKAGSGAPVTEEEVKEMIAEGAETGVFKAEEKSMIESVMRLADRGVRSLMTPRGDIVWLAVEDSREENLRIIHESGRSRFPVGRGDLDEVLGVVYAKDMLNAVLDGTDFKLEALMRAPLFVPDTTPVTRLVDQFRDSRKHLAIVIDEYGSVEGLVTATDVLEAIIGDLPDPQEADGENPVQRADGSWLIDGMQPIDEVEALLGFKNMRGDVGEYHTLAGFVIEELGRIPASGDAFDWNGARFEVVDMDGRRVDKVLVVPPEPDADEDWEG